LLLTKPELRGIVNEWTEHHLELEDKSLDFIAHLFARDEVGKFVELEKYFAPFLIDDKSSIIKAIDRLIHSTIHQESIRLYESRDPIGRVFYRSLRYILTKNSRWKKMGTGSEALLTHKKLVKSQPVELDKLDNYFVLHDELATSLVKTIESGLYQIIEIEKKSVRIGDILQALRKHMKILTNQKYFEESKSLEMSIKIHIKETISKIDQKILKKYVLETKINAIERQAYHDALYAILKDFSNNYNGYSYFDYLSIELSSLISKKDYYEKYRRQFEYLAKIAKRQFSAKIKSDFKLD